LLPQQPQYSLTFKDLDSGDDAYCSVREVPGAVGITLSLRQSGDVDVFMNWQAPLSRAIRLPWQM